MSDANENVDSNPVALVGVNSAKGDRLTDLYELEIVVTGYEGNPAQVALPFGWHKDDAFGLGPAVTEWMAAHPDFEIAAYTPPVVTADMVAAEAQRRVNAASHDAMVNLTILQIPVPPAVIDACTAINAKRDSIAAMTPIPANYAADGYWQ